MKSLSLWIQVGVAVLLSLFGRAATAEELAAQKNVLLILVDDLRTELRCYGAEHISSPNIDRLASSGRLFQRAYCQQAVCNPSRTSFMTGLLPDSVGVTGNHAHFRDLHPGIVTLPQYFKKHGYFSTAVGKIYHGVFPEGSSKTSWDTMGDAASWSEPATRFGPRYYYTEEGIAAAKQAYKEIYGVKKPAPNEWTEKLVFGPATEAPDVEDDVLYDGKVASTAIEKLSELKDREQPFFLAVGFIKPHSPYIAPSRYHEIYRDVPATSSVSDSYATRLPQNAPAFAGHGSGEVRRYTDQPRRGEIPKANQQQIRQSYFACVSFIDAQIGRVLDALEENELSKNTIVVLASDHGYHLGEQGLWGKTTNFELDTRVPLIIRTQDMKHGGEAASSPVELLDLFPTIVDLAGLPKPAFLQGQSLAPAVYDPRAKIRDFARSQFPRGKLMGYSIRDETQRLTLWQNKESNKIEATELYRYPADTSANGQIEKINIADNSQELVARLTETLLTSFSLSTQEGTSVGNEVTRERSKFDAQIGRIEGFEALAAGQFEELKTELGNWRRTSGIAKVDPNHAKSGRKCLQLTGGKGTSVELELSQPLSQPSRLSFWAERWTKRSPFQFRIDAKVGAVWQQVYDGDQKVRVGRAFLNHVQLSLPASLTKSISILRFSCTSPENTGVLIDDLAIDVEEKQKIVGVKIEPFTIPAIVGRDSPLARLQVTTRGLLKPLSLRALDFSVAKSETLKEIFVANGSPPGTLSLISNRVAVEEIDQLEIQPNQLAAGENNIWICGSIRENTHIDEKTSVTIENAQFSDGSEFTLPAHEQSQLLGVALRKSGDDDVSTYRIPGLVRTNSGTLIAVYDARRRSARDLPGDIDVGMSRSEDGGRTWEPMRIIMDMGDDPKWQYDGIGDPAVLVDEQTGTIWVAATWSHGNRSWFGSGPGLSAEETGQLMLVKSDDDGRTWSAPINITEQVKKPEWCFLLQGPGKGITMQDGTLVFAAQYQDPVEENRLPHSTILYSRDHGESWQVGTGAFDDTTEAQVVEVSPGVLMLNCRYNRKSVRVVRTTNDLGDSWETHVTSQRSLIEPRACMASLINVDRELGLASTGRLLFSNPNSLAERSHLTIKASTDSGVTWPKDKRLLLDEGRGRGYSCMTMIDDSTVGIVYESSQADLVFQRVPLEEILPKHPHAPAKPVNREPSRSSARLWLPQVFSDHMVLQANRPIAIWGRGPPDSSVSVRLDGETQSTDSNAEGNWQIKLRPRKPSSRPRTLVVLCNGETKSFSDVVLGEVWICAGQSNMEWPLKKATTFASELKRLKASPETNIRLLHLQGGALGSSGSYGERELARLTPDTFLKGSWQKPSADSIANLSAVAWHFGRQLSTKLDVPVGVIQLAVGGTPTEAWIPREVLERNAKLSHLARPNWLDNPALGEFCRERATQNLLNAMQSGEAIQGDQLGPNHSFKPGFMWSAGIEKIAPFSCRGFVWYQGESNAETLARVRQHDELFPELVGQWRKLWQANAIEQMPFLFVQLPAIDREYWPWFRESQRRMRERIEGVSMAVSIDTGHKTNVHPPKKDVIGQRLAETALSDVYDQKGSKFSPQLSDVKFVDNKIILQFESAGNLASIDAQPLRHFEVCAEDYVFYPASAKIESGNEVHVWSEHVRAPKYVRYAWSPYPSPSVNLKDLGGRPVAPFTTLPSTFTETTRAKIENATSKSRPNILLIVGEDHGCELSCYGDLVIDTPNIDRLASEGILFQNAYVTQSVCSPSRSTLFTGLYPHQNGQLGLATHQYSFFKKWPTSYSLLKEAGYRTGLIGKTHVNPAEAVEDFVDFRFQPSSNFSKKKVAQYATEAAKFFSAGEEPFFMTVNYPDAHWPLQNEVDGMPVQRVDPQDVRVMPYVGVENKRLKKISKNYYDCMLRLDECVGQLLSELDKSGKASNTLVVFIGDHGAQMARGKVTVYEGGVRVPYIVRWPKRILEATKSAALVSTIDLLPTFLDVAQVESAQDLPGESLCRIFKDPDSELRKYLVCERNCDAARHTFPQRTVRDSRFKLIFSPVRDREDPAARYYRIHGASHWSGCPTDEELSRASSKIQEGYRRWLNPPEIQLYDLEEDPSEWRNLADLPEFLPVRERLWQALAKWQAETNDYLASPSKLELLLNENFRTHELGLRSPKGGWKYLEYLAED